MPCWTHKVARLSKKLFKAYEGALERHSFLTQSIQTGVLCGVSDVLAQRIVERNHKYDFNRTVQFSFVGTIFTGPILIHWYKLLNWKYPDRSRISCLKKVALDQLVFTPPFSLLFIIVLGIVQRDGWEKTAENLQDNYVDIMIMNYYTWPITQYINFRVVPLKHQVLYEQIISLFWSTYMSWKTHCAWDEDSTDEPTLLHPKCLHKHEKKEK